MQINWYKLIDFRSHYYEVKRGVRSLIYWIPKVWGDREFDSHYFLRLLKYKIERDLDYYLNKSPVRYEGQENHESQMNELITVLGRILDDEYIDLVTLTEIIDKIHSGFDLSEIKNGFSELVWKEPLSDEENEIYRKCCEEAYDYELRDRAKVFDTLKDN